MKRFVVPIDFSAESHNGLKMALLFSKKTAVDIQLVYVITKTAEPGSTSLETEPTRCTSASQPPQIHTDQFTAA